MRSTVIGVHFQGEEVRVWFPGVEEDQWIFGIITSHDEIGILLANTGNNGTECQFIPYTSIKYITRPEG